MAWNLSTVNQWVSNAFLAINPSLVTSDDFWSAVPYSSQTNSLLLSLCMGLVLMPGICCTPPDHIFQWPEPSFILLFFLLGCYCLFVCLFLILSPHLLQEQPGETMVTTIVISSLTIWQPSSKHEITLTPLVLGKGLYHSKRMNVT